MASMLSTPMGVVTVGVPRVRASRTLSFMPLPNLNGATTTRALWKYSSGSSTKPTMSIPPTLAAFSIKLSGGLFPPITNLAFGSDARISGQASVTNHSNPSMLGSQLNVPRKKTSGSVSGHCTSGNSSLESSPR